MKDGMRSKRTVCAPPPAGDEHVVLRLAREALHQDPPRVRFIDRAARAAPRGEQQWRTSA